MSAGEEWAYTLYVRPSGEPFVHALDTVHRRAVCVDLPSLSAEDVGTAHLRLGPDGGGGRGGTTLEVDVDGTTRAQVDTRTFAVTTGSGRPTPRERHASSGTSWVLIAAVVGALGALGALALVFAIPARPLARHSS